MGTSMLMLVASAAAIGQQAVYEWAGGSTGLGEPENWQGSNPLDPNNLPTTTRLGSPNQPLLTRVPSGTSLAFGRSVTFSAGTTLVVPAGATVQLRSAPGGVGPGIFDPVPQSVSARSPLFDLRCNLNWRDNGAIPLSQPCTNTVGQFPDDGRTYVASSYAQPTAFARLTRASEPVGIGSCPSSSGQGSDSAQYLGQSVLVFLPQCPALARFGAANQTASCTTAPVQGLAAACGRQVTFRAETGAPETATSYTLVLGGAYAGTALQTVLNTLVNVTANVTYDATAMTYSLGNVSVDIATGAVSTNQAYPRSGSASGTSEGGLGANLPLVVGVAAAVLIMVIVAVVLVRRSAANDEPQHPPSHTSGSFENPMYDHATGHPTLELVPGDDPWMGIPEEYRPDSRSASSFDGDEVHEGFGDDADSYFDVAVGGGFDDVDDTY